MDMKKIFSILALALAVMTASAKAGFDLKVGKSEKGTVMFLVEGTEVTNAAEGAAVTPPPPRTRRTSRKRWPT